MVERRKVIPVRDAVRLLIAAGYADIGGGKHRTFYHEGIKHSVNIPFSPKGDCLYGHMARAVYVAVALVKQHETGVKRLNSVKLHERGRFIQWPK